MKAHGQILKCQKRCQKKFQDNVLVLILPVILSQCNDSGSFVDTLIDKNVETAEFLRFLKARHIAETADVVRASAGDETVHSDKARRTIRPFLTKSIFKEMP